ncbi:hypothetical protein [Streptomyces acidicola]|uniref:hypothetical protein n=1 Tax=Streptomyces acidicola TaxID=2596892 RepID=UPI00380A0AB5
MGTAEIADPAARTDLLALAPGERPQSPRASITLIGDARATVQPRGLKDLKRLEHIRALLADQGHRPDDAVWPCSPCTASIPMSSTPPGAAAMSSSSTSMRCTATAPSATWHDTRQNRVTDRRRPSPAVSVGAGRMPTKRGSTDLPLQRDDRLDDQHIPIDVRLSLFPGSGSPAKGTNPRSAQSSEKQDRASADTRLREMRRHGHNERISAVHSGCITVSP